MTMADPAPVIPDEGRAIWLVSGSAGIFGAGSPAFVLFQTDTDVLSDSTFADFIEATFSGYARIGIVLGPVFLNGDGLQEQDWSPAVWTHDGGGEANDIYGWLLLHDAGSGGAKIMAGQNFDPPRTMAALSDVIPVLVNSLFDPAPAP